MRDALAKAAPNVVYSTEWGIMYIPPGDQPDESTILKKWELLHFKVTYRQGCYMVF